MNPLDYLTLIIALIFGISAATLVCVFNIESKVNDILDKVEQLEDILNKIKRKKL